MAKPPDDVTKGLFEGTRNGQTGSSNSQQPKPQPKPEPSKKDK